MLFINLLPDIKIEFIKIQRLRRALTALALIIVPCCIAVCGWLYYQVSITNPRQLEDVIKTNNQLAGTILETRIAIPGVQVNGVETPDEIGLEEVLTIKRQLEALKPLHDNKIEIERLFNFSELNYLDKFMYGNTYYTSLAFNFKENTFIIEGIAENSSAAERLKRAMQYVGFDDCTESNLDTRLYPITVKNFSRPARTTKEDPEINFTIAGTFDPILFESKEAKRIKENWTLDSEAYLQYDPNQALDLVFPKGIFSDDAFGRGHNCKALPTIGEEIIEES